VAQLIFQILTLVLLVGLVAALWIRAENFEKKAVRYAVTLVQNEGAFIGLCTKKRRDYWTFVDVRVQPTNPGGAVVQAAPGELHVPYRNILYYQEIQETANVAE
jgi:hypothetical protein